MSSVFSVSNVWKTWNDGIAKFVVEYFDSSVQV